MPRLPVDLDRFSERCHSSGAFVCGIWIRFEISIFGGIISGHFFSYTSVHLLLGHSGRSIGRGAGLHFIAFAVPVPALDGAYTTSAGL